MTTKSELIEQVKALQEQIDAMPDDVAFGRTTWQAGEVVEFYRVRSSGVIIKSCDCWGRIKDSEGLGIWFWTKEEAEFWLEKQRLLRDIREFVGRDPDWYDMNEQKFTVTYDCLTEQLSYDRSHCNRIAGEIYIGSTATQAMDVTNKFGDRIKKYFLE